MNRIYSLSYRLIAYLLFISFLLQSCGGFQNQLVPQEKKQRNRTLELSDNPLVNTDKEIVISEGYLASFYEEDRELKADLRADAIQPQPNYRAVSVVVEEGTNLSKLTKLDIRTQQNRFQLKRGKNGQPSAILVLKGAISGGMMEGDDYQEKEPESGFSNYQKLIEFAYNEDPEAQFQLGKRAYQIWLEKKIETTEHEAIEWLTKAKAKGHEGAAALLEQVNSFRVQEKKGEEKEKEKEDKKNEAAWTERNFNISFLPIDPDTIEYIEEIGRGGMGQVFKARYQGKEVAVKSLHNLRKEQINAFIKEARIIANLKHPNIIGFLGFFTVPDNKNFRNRIGPFPRQEALMMEYVPQGSLWRLLEVNQRDNSWDTSWQVRYQIALNVAEGLSYLHQWDIVHCDLKSENILIAWNSRGEVQAKITDFGTSALKTENQTYGEWEGGTCRWMAPELFGQNKNSKAGDVYSYGMILWQLGARKEPFEAYDNNFQIAKHITNGNQESITEDTHLTIRKIIELCWISELERPKMKQVRHLLEAGHPNFVDKQKEKLQEELNKEVRNSQDAICPNRPNSYLENGWAIIKPILISFSFGLGFRGQSILDIIKKEPESNFNEFSDSNSYLKDSWAITKPILIGFGVCSILDIIIKNLDILIKKNKNIELKDEDKQIDKGNINWNKLHFYLENAWTITKPILIAGLAGWSIYNIIIEKTTTSMEFPTVYSQNTDYYQNNDPTYYYSLPIQYYRELLRRKS